MNCINKVFLLSIIIVFVFTTKIFCDVSIETYLDKKNISIGDNINLRIEIIPPKGSVLISPGYDCIKDWYVKDIAVKKNKNNLYSINMIITTFKVDIKEIPSINFEFVDKDKNSSFISTKPIDICITNTLASNIAEIDKLKNVKGVKKIEIKTVYMYILFLFLFYFILLLLFQIIKKNKEFKNVKRNKIKKDMIENLDDILSQNYDIETKYLNVFDIILKFVKIEYNIEPNKNIPDIISEMTELDISSISFRIISDILDRVQISKDGKADISDIKFVKDVNNLKFVISNSFEKKDEL